MPKPKKILVLSDYLLYNLDEKIDTYNGQVTELPGNMGVILTLSPKTRQKGHASASYRVVGDTIIKVP